MSSVAQPTCDRAADRHYEQAGLRYYSVSQVLEVLRTGPQWSDQQAMQRGTDVHRLCMLAMAARAGLCEAPATAPEYQGYLDSFTQWLDIAKPELLGIEQAVVAGAGLLYAGTYDMLCRMHDKGKRYETIVELKTGQRQPLHRVQVQAYGKLEPRAARLGLLYVHADGGMPMWEVVKPSTRDWAAFQAALSVLIYREGV